MCLSESWTATHILLSNNNNKNKKNKTKKELAMLQHIKE